MQKNRYFDGKNYILQTITGEKIKIPYWEYHTRFPSPKIKLPHAGSTNLIFRTKDGILHRGRYVFKDFNINQPKWIDQVGNEYTSDMVDEWEDL